MMGQGGCLAIEDACVLAEILRATPSTERALATYVNRRTPRVTWVQQQSQSIAQSFRLAPDVRDSVLREKGDASFRARFSPLIKHP
jgi:2-heptyl-3-hydroxy-4(1H)-quinolone synthase